MVTPVWGKEKDKKWKQTFTRDNKTGGRKLAFELRHKTPAEVVRNMKSRDMEVEKKNDAEARRIGRLAGKDAIPRPEYPKVGGEYQPLELEGPYWSVRIKEKFKPSGLLGLLCVIGIHKWDGAHKANAYEQKYHKICERCRIFGPEIKTGW